MEYTMLSKIYYQKPNEYEQEYNNRYNSPAVTHLNFKIHDNQAFYLTTPEIFTSFESIYDNLRIMEKYLSALPKAAQICYSKTCLIDEIIMSNNIEQVYSSRKDVTDVLDVLEHNSTYQTKMRLFGMVQKYNFLYQEIEVSLDSVQDIRSIYDDFILPEIEREEDKPDGKLFRKNGVDVVSQTEKVKHSGINGEDKIIAALTNALSILNQNNNHLVNIAIFHYLFGYIHPFYEGNGRLSRFISSYKLSHFLNPLVACRLSFMIKNNQSVYYNAFDYCNDKKNKGDLTPFITIFLDIINQSILSLMEKINDGIEKLSHFFDIIDSRKLNEKEEPMVALLIQQALFAPEEPFTINDIAKIAKKSVQYCRNLIDSLIKKQIPIIITKDGHSHKYSIDLDELDNMRQQ